MQEQRAQSAARPHGAQSSSRSGSKPGLPARGSGHGSACPRGSRSGEQSRLTLSQVSPPVHAAARDTAGRSPTFPSAAAVPVRRTPPTRGHWTRCMGRLAACDVSGHRAVVVLRSTRQGYAELGPRPVCPRGHTGVRRWEGACWDPTLSILRGPGRLHSPSPTYGPARPVVPTAALPKAKGRASARGRRARCRGSPVESE